MVSDEEERQSTSRSWFHNLHALYIAPLIVTVVGGILLAIFSQERKGKPASNATHNRTKKSVPEDDAKTPIKVSDLLKATTTGQRMSRYDGKSLTVLGPVDGIYLTVNKVLLQGSTGDSDRLTCRFHDSQMEKVKKLSKGQIVIIRGVYTVHSHDMRGIGRYYEGFLEDCEIVETQFRPE